MTWLILETDPVTRTLTLHDPDGATARTDQGIGAGDRLSRYAFTHGAERVRHDYDLRPYER